MTERSERTRARLQNAALELFLEHGYDETTVAQIAAAVGVSQMTFFRHFPTKESVVLDDPYDPLIAAAVLAQRSDLPAFERVRRGLREAWRRLPEPAEEQTRDKIRLAVRHPALRAATFENNHRTEAIIVEALESAGVPRMDAVVAAGACLGAIMGALVDWGTSGDDAPLGERVLAALACLPHEGNDPDE
ncbi:MAG TPA: TetR/AcrR family transcriptional regulator [Candidatus Lustribacter sp.]|nr:TetR/AcrR family transcriptional regulator [Candidatus Lustribacter sp.]